MTFFHRWRRTRGDVLIAIFDSLSRIEQRLIAMARTEQELSDDLDKIQTGLASVASAQQALKDEIAALQAAGAAAVTQDQLDGLVAKADSLVASTQALGAPAPPPAA